MEPINDINESIHEFLYERIKTAIKENDTKTLEVILKPKSPQDIEQKYVEHLEEDIFNKLLQLTKLANPDKKEQERTLSLILMSQKKGHMFNLLVYAFALRGDKDTVDSLLEFILQENKEFSINVAIHAFAISNNTSAVDAFLANIVDENNPASKKNHDLNKKSAILGYATGFRIEKVQELLEMGVSVESAAEGFIKGGHCDSFFKEVQTLTSFNKTIDQDSLLNSVALQGNNKRLNIDADKIRNFIKLYESNQNIKANKNNFNPEYFASIMHQYERQKPARRLRIFLVVLAAILFPPSLIVSLPLFFRAEKKNPIQKFSVSTKTNEQIKSKRQKLRDTDPKVEDNNQPPKIILSTTSKKIVALGDGEKLARLNFFRKHDQNYLHANRAGILAGLKESKDRSKVIYAGIRLR